MFTLKLLPFVGTTWNAVEAVGALIDGDGKRFLAKSVQTIGGVGMDTVLVMSGGLSTLVTAPLKIAAIEGGKVAAFAVVRGTSEVIVDKSNVGKGKSIASYNRSEKGDSLSRLKANIQNYSLYQLFDQ